MRRKLEIIIDEKGKRDKGKLFIIEEMPCQQAEKWAIKIFLALGKAGITIPENIVEMGLPGLAIMGFKALHGLRFEDAEPILDEMMQYIRIRPDKAHPQVERELLDGDVEEITTMLKLRKEIFNLNIDFFAAVTD